jgi:hypothetical protein
MELPVTIATMLLAAGTCGCCGRERAPADDSAPGVYTVASVEADPPVPPVAICDDCVAHHDPELFAELLDYRQRLDEER